jgi:hypothetical protein
MMADAPTIRLAGFYLAETAIFRKASLIHEMLQETTEIFHQIHQRTPLMPMLLLGKFQPQMYSNPQIL